MSGKKKKAIRVIIIVLLIAFVICIFPIPWRPTSSGMTEYRAVLYRVIKYHRADENYASGYYTGIEIYVLGTKVFSNCGQDYDP